MSEQPILFNARMVRAILNGHKAQTRRPVRLPAEQVNTEWLASHRSPFGKDGDTLWVRETWAGLFTSDNGDVLMWRDVRQEARTQDNCEDIWYRADGDDLDYTGCWVPSIFMPRWASRLELLVKNVRVERLCNIDGSDAIAEGASTAGWMDPCDLSDIARGNFRADWDSIYADKGYGWDVNPRVWACEFEVVRQ